MEKELKYLQGELADPARPFVVILGGSKVSDKIGVIKALMEKANTFLIGGAMAYTFYKAQGIPIGNSRVENDKIDLARNSSPWQSKKGVKFLLPVDNIETLEIKAGTTTARNTGLLSPGHGITDGYEAVDIGKETIELYKKEIATAKTVLWNGPVGIFEIPDFARGTFSLAEALAASDATTIIGGGDSVTAVKQAGLGRQDDVHLHRRRRVARTARRQGTARRGRARTGSLRPSGAVDVRHPPPMRKAIIAANWKMNMTVDETASYINTFLAESGDDTDVDVVHHPAVHGAGEGVGVDVAKAIRSNWARRT